ncbi:AAA family ATPase [Pseudomassariella vexata]|uniref:AAA family ATPase n=1 Tax=Pseudomassariella vexata TaxID=1141098 RepID=A0A1Y2DVK1_9PEZI|nr:AAA family ATPase [Pseudomassariella vexata]ORY63320.1 AAA family ATPase [Pseudomassariella vexata]
MDSCLKFYRTHTGVRELATMSEVDERKSTQLDSLEARLRELENKYADLEKRYKSNPTNDKGKYAQSESDDTSTNEVTQRFRILVNRYDSSSGERKDFEPKDSDAASKDKQSTKYAWQLRKVIDQDEEDYSEIEIFGKPLRDLLQRLLHHYPYHLFLGDIVILVSPYEPLVHNWCLLYKETAKDGGDENEKIARNDLKEMMETIRQGSGDPKLDEYFKVRESLRASRSITFSNLWTIFPPGMLVYGRPFMKQPQVFIVMENDLTWPVFNPRSHTHKTWELGCFTYDWTGQRFKRRLIKLRIDSFEGQKPIATLPIQPWEGMEKANDIKKQLLERGRIFRKYCTLPSERRLFKYAGKAIVNRSGIRGVVPDMDRDMDDDTIIRRRNYLHRSIYPNDTSNTEPNYSTINSDVMIDFESFYKYGPPFSSIGSLQVDDEKGECDCFDCHKNQALQDNYRTRYDEKTGDECEEWEDLQFMLCAPRVLGYVLRDKTWAQLDVNLVNPIATGGADDAFMNKLKLAGPENGRNTKELLMGLVKNHGISESSNWSHGYQLDDIVADKGKGLIILLYGPPGVGKTSTAQTIAIAAGKPLFSIGVADVGTSAKLVESNLEKIFDLATSWKAVLLIDEADVFLQSRARGELGPTTERNALVSVFLRVLEYYQGIMILTTNQISQFDVAVQSRIHIAIRYEKLKEYQTWAIFKSFMEQYEARGLVDQLDTRMIERWAKGELPKKNFDGRQIRNIVTSAMGIARSAERKMNHDDLLNVVGIMETFKSDLAYQMMQYEDSQKSRFG